MVVCRQFLFNYYYELLYSMSSCESRRVVFFLFNHLWLYYLIVYVRFYLNVFNHLYLMAYCITECIILYYTIKSILFNYVFT